MITTETYGIEADIERHLADGSKFDVSELTDSPLAGELHAFAVDWLRAYEGSFAFLTDVKARMLRRAQRLNLATASPLRFLTVGEAKGVLNCYLADRRRETRPVQTVILPDVAEGRYAVEIIGELTFFQVDRPTEGRWAGRTFVSQLLGSPGDFNRRPVRDLDQKTRILQGIADDPDALARFGQKLGVCGVCGSPLTDARSRELGIGPVCRSNRGLFQ